ncbi:hypothetical protein INN71_11875 [Nocardioides sp. ChNu-153]|uniref:hypothetical protein n=1 Tax=unclassified Nocardioides TaxID=2615069 RepID=UPI002405E7DA|nr:MULTISPECIES: hypothetical protein [unclassified Nocardioides]MDF9716494.1 hypothetical protein [Nocardioides sp. ChNu-99]MDN7122087.1 hypothetical protein [Nocardioides sp. ChNu-153]
MTTPQEPSPSDPTWSWGAPPPAGKDGIATTDSRRPGSVVAAAVVTIVSCTLAGLLWALAGVVALIGAVFIASSDDGTSVEGLGDTIGMAAGAAGAVLLTCALLAVVAIVLAVGVLRGSSGARTALVVLSIMAAVAYLGLAVLAGAGGDPLTSMFAVVYLAVCVTTAVLLLHRETRTWFERGGRPGAALAAGPGYGGPPPGSAPWGPGPQHPQQPWR